jgi:hypothetical protein
VCAEVQQQALIFAQKLQQQLDRGEAAELKEDIALAQCRIMGCCKLVPVGEMPCCWSEQLPASLQPGDWCITRPLARSAPRGRQRAEAGTATARNFNYGSNAPYQLGNTAEMLQLLQGDEAAAAAAAAASRDMQVGADGSLLYGIRSAHTASGLVCHVVAKKSGMQAAAGINSMWDRSAAVCKKRVLRGKSLDLLNAAFICCIGEQAATGSKSKAAE